MMDQTHKDDATRRLGRALVYILSLANQEEAADAERVSEVPPTSAADGSLDPEKRRDYADCHASYSDSVDRR